jgi:PAS domain S-box-containing protein
MNASSQPMNWPTLESVINFSPIVVLPETLLVDAIALMGQAHPCPEKQPQGHSGCVLVVEHSQLIGIVTAHDVVRVVAAQPKLSKVKVAEVMTHPVISHTYSQSDSVLTAWSLLRHHQIRHLPIVSRQGEVVGLVTQNDLIQCFNLPEPSMSALAQPSMREEQFVNPEPQRQELELLSDQRRLEAFFSQSPDGFFFMMLDRPIRWNDTVDQEALLDYVFNHQRVTKVNAAMLAQYDAAEDEFIGLTPQDFFAHDVETGRQLWQEMFDKGRLHVETFEQKLDGTSMWIEGDYSCLYNLNGDIIGHFGIQRDISDRKQSEENLRQSQQDLTDFVENAIVCLHWVASDGTIVWANQAELDLLGYTREEYIGHSITEFHADQTAIEDILQKLLSDQPVRDYETDLRCKDGSIRHVLIDSNSSWRNDKFVRTRCFTRDITDRKHAEEALRQSEQRLQSMLDNSTAVIYMKDTQGRYMMINHSYEALFHLDRNTVKGKTDQDIFPKEIADAFQANDREVIAAGIALEKEEVAPQDDGLHTFISIKFPLFDTEGKIYAVCGMSTDISDRKQAEIELQNQKQELARSNHELQQFAYVASHDLQEPLRMITSYLELLERRYKGQLDDKADKFIAYAVDGATRMQTLINDLLSYSRLGMRGQEFESVDCAKILRNVLTNLQVAIAQSSAVVTYDSLPQLNADPSQLTQLFQNLLSNAIKFRRDDPPQIHIGVKCINDKWLFSVCDNGMGIDTQYMDRIFIIFQRLQSRTEYPGTGIGLAVCKKIVERHQGRLWVESQLGQGSTFHFTLPYTGGVPL